MKEYYQRCPQCDLLAALLTYFLSTEENAELSPEDRRLCYDCYQENRAKKANSDNQLPLVFASSFKEDGKR